VSSADAHEGDSVDFDVLEAVAASGIVVIPKRFVPTVGGNSPARRVAQLVAQLVRGLHQGTQANQQLRFGIAMVRDQEVETQHP